MVAKSSFTLGGTHLQLANVAGSCQDEDFCATGYSAAASTMVGSCQNEDFCATGYSAAARTWSELPGRRLLRNGLLGSCQDEGSRR